VATSTQPAEGQGQVPSARPWEPRLSLGLTAGLAGPMLIPGHRTVLAPPPSDHEPVQPSDHEPVHLLLEEECMPDFVGVVNQGIARPEDSYV
jgi:hypothetical protein